MDKFQVKSIAEQEAMTPDELTTYMEAARVAKEAELKSLIADGTEKNAVEIAEIKAEMKEADKVVLDAVKQIGQTVHEMQRVSASYRDNRTTYEQELHKAIEDNQGEIEAVFKSKSGMVEMKVVGDITTGSGTLATALPATVGTDRAPLTRVGLRAAFILGLTNNENTTTESFQYTEVSPKEGDFVNITEGDTKSQIDFNWITRTANAVELAAWVRLTNPAVKDVANLASVATGYLKDKHDLKKQNNILFGTGTPPQPEGATVAATTFTAGAMLNLVQVPDIMDVIGAIIADIRTTPNFVDETPYMPNLVLMNDIDFFLEFMAAKDTGNRRLFEQASTFGQITIGGMTIMPESTIPAGSIFVGDMSKYNTTNYEPYSIRMGWVNDDFIKNQFVMLGESRFHAFVKNFDKKAFRYDVIATIKAALLKP